MPISIAGMHRSGTSLTAQLLHLCGIYLGPEKELSAPAPDGLDGFWRHPLEVAGSLSRRNGMSLAFGFRLWQAYYQRLLAAVPPTDRIVSHYSAYFHDAAAELRRVLEFIAFPAADEVVDQACTAVKPS